MQPCGIALRAFKLRSVHFCGESNIFLTLAHIGALNHSAHTCSPVLCYVWRPRPLCRRCTDCTQREEKWKWPTMLQQVEQLSEHLSSPVVYLSAPTGYLVPRLYWGHCYNQTSLSWLLFLRSLSVSAHLNSCSEPLTYLGGPQGSVPVV